MARIIRPSGRNAAPAHTEALAAGEVSIREIRTRDAAVELRSLRAAVRVEQFPALQSNPVPVRNRPGNLSDLWRKRERRPSLAACYSCVSY
jgi:hypothetical protein